MGQVTEQEAGMFEAQTFSAHLWHWGQPLEEASHGASSQVFP